MKTELFDRVNRNYAGEEKKKPVFQAHKDMSKEFVICIIVGVIIGVGIVFSTMMMMHILGVI